MWYDFFNAIFLAQIICSGVATMIYWRQRAAISRLSAALEAVCAECESPTLWPEMTKQEQRTSWATTHAIAVRALRGKRW